MGAWWRLFLDFGHWTFRLQESPPHDHDHDCINWYTHTHTHIASNGSTHPRVRQRQHPRPTISSFGPTNRPILYSYCQMDLGTLLPRVLDFGFRILDLSRFNSSRYRSAPPSPPSPPSPSSARAFPLPCSLCALRPSLFVRWYIVLLS